LQIILLKFTIYYTIDVLNIVLSVVKC